MGMMEITKAEAEYLGPIIFNRCHELKMLQKTPFANEAWGDALRTLENLQQRLKEMMQEEEWEGYTE